MHERTFHFRLFVGAKPIVATHAAYSFLEVDCTARYVDIAKQMPCLEASPHSLREVRLCVAQQRDSQIHPELQDLPQRGVGLEAGVHGDPRGVPEMDHADPPLETGPQPLRGPLGGPHARANQKPNVRTGVTQKEFQAPARFYMTCMRLLVALSLLRRVNAILSRHLVRGKTLNGFPANFLLILSA